MKTIVLTLIVLIAAILAFSACTPGAEPLPEAAPQEPPQNPASEAPVEESGPDLENLARDLNDAFNEGDAAAIKAFYGPDAAVCTPDWGEECTSGEEAIGRWIEELVDVNFKIEPQSYQVNGDKVTVLAEVWADPSRAMEIAPLVTTDVYTFEDDRIINQTSTLDEESAAKLMAAMAEGQAMEVISAVNDAWNAGDVAALKTLYAADAAVCMPDWGPDCTVGEEAIGQWIEELVGVSFVIEAESLEVDGNIVTEVAKVWADPSRELGIAPLVTTDVYTLKDGQIINQTSTLDEESAAKLIAAMAEGQAMEIISAVNDAWNAGDVAALKTLYAADAAVCTPDWDPDCTVGEEAIGQWIEELVGVNFVIEAESLEVEDDTVTEVAKVWADPSRELGIAPLVTTDVYTLKDGQIVNQISTLDEESAVKLAAAMEALEEPAAEDSTPPVPLAASAEEILGAWKWTAGDMSIRFDEDGTARMAYKPDELQGAPYYTFSYVFDGTSMDIREIAGFGVASCGSAAGSYEIQLLESGNIQLVVVDDDCGRSGDIPGEYEPLPDL